MSSYNVPQLVEAVREAVKLSEEAKRAIAKRDQALHRLTGAVGGDRLAAISNAQHRIGWLMTEEET